MSIAVLAQALPSASSGMDWLYQFTNNLTNLTTQNGGALTQLGLTELSCISLFTLVSMVINWNTSTMTFRLHHHPVRAGDLTHFLLKLIVCCLLLNYWVNPFPGASFGINHFFSYIAQAMVAAFDQHSLDQLLAASEDGWRWNAHAVFYCAGSDPLLCACPDHARTRIRHSVCHQLQRLHPLRCDRALWPCLCAVAHDTDLQGEVLSLPRCAHQLRHDSRCGCRVHLSCGRDS